MLEGIMATAHARVAELRRREGSIRGKAEEAPDPRGFATALRGQGLAVVAEVKRVSPSAGEISPNLDPADLAAQYERGGTSAVSVLTDPLHFGAREGDLEAVRQRVTVPVLRKDFIVDSLQVWEARAMGADAVLLLCAVLDDNDLALLLETVRRAGLEALVEIHTSEEARRASSLGCSLVGVNNRDLRDFSVDLDNAARLRDHLPAEATTVAESGITGVADAQRMAAAGFDAVLVGEAAVRSDDAAAFVASLRGGE